MMKDILHVGVNAYLNNQIQYGVTNFHQFQDNFSETAK